MRNDIAGISEFSNRVLTAEDFIKLANIFIENITSATRPSYVSFMLFDLSRLSLVVERRRGFHTKRELSPTLKQHEKLNGADAGHGSVFVLANNGAPRFFSFFDPEEPHAGEILVPFAVCANYLGILNLGKKQTAAEYGIEDIHYLQIVTNFVTAASFKSHLCPAIYFAKGENPRACSAELCAGYLFTKPKIHVSRGRESFDLLGESATMRHIRDLIARVAGQDVPVLITGESGTGKELIARAIHRQSRRAANPLVEMNCAALPETLVESELFGYERGAFTGAVAQKKGKFEYAHGSTLFLDEIGDMSLATQAKLLRVLQDGTFYRVGGNAPAFADVRIVAATNKDLETMAMEKTFREDLYYRLNVVQIEVPPLRARSDDILLLADFYFQHYNFLYEKNLAGFADEALEWLLLHSFPGNVRELKNIIEHAIIMEPSDRITLASLPLGKKGAPALKRANETSLAELEKEHIMAVMQQVNFNKSEAARLLGIARKTLREKLLKYQI